LNSNSDPKFLVIFQVYQFDQLIIIETENVLASTQVRLSH